MKRPAGHETGEPLICGNMRAGATAPERRPARCCLGCEDRDRDIEQQRQAEAQQCQRHKGDACPQDVDAEAVGHAGADAEDHAIATILAKTLCHFCPFHPGPGAGVLGGGGVRRSDDQRTNLRTILTDDREQHDRRIERSESSERVALDRAGGEMSHDIVLPVTFRPDHPVDAKGNAGGVPICFCGR